jgi:hypothetical protein
MAGRIGATGRTDRTVITIAGIDLVTWRHPEKVLPLHNSHALPGEISRLLTTNGGSMCCLGPVIVRLTPFEWPRLYKVIWPLPWAAA